jgi:hypothetical protein
MGNINWNKTLAGALHTLIVAAVAQLPMHKGITGLLIASQFVLLCWIMTLIPKKKA